MKREAMQQAAKKKADNKLKETIEMYEDRIKRFIEQTVIVNKNNQDLYEEMQYEIADLRLIIYLQTHCGFDPYGMENLIINLTNSSNSEQSSSET